MGKAVALRPLPSFLASLLTLIVSFDSLRTELEKLHHHLGMLLDYVGARNTSHVERLDNASCRIQDIVDFGVHRGAAVVLLMGEIFSCFRLQDIIDPL